LLYKFYWETPPINSKNLQVLEEFPSMFSAQKVKLKCVDYNNQKFGLNSTMIATITTPLSLITGPPWLIKLEKEVIAYAVIKNCSPCAIWIKKMILWVVQNTRMKRKTEKRDE
jgi:hypothetical protein